MKLLEGVVGQHQCARLLGDAQDESVAPPYRTGRWGDHLSVLHGLLEGRHFRRVDTVAEGGIDDHRHIRRGKAAVLLEKGPDGLVELGQAGEGTSFGGDVGTVDDDPSTVGEILIHRGHQSTI